MIQPPIRRRVSDSRRHWPRPRSTAQSRGYSSGLSTYLDVLNVEDRLLAASVRRRTAAPSPLDIRFDSCAGRWLPPQPTAKETRMADANSPSETAEHAGGSDTTATSGEAVAADARSRAPGKPEAFGSAAWPSRSWCSVCYGTAVSAGQAQPCQHRQCLCEREMAQVTP